MSTQNEALQKWVDEVRELTQPDRVHWCDGSEEEYNQLVQEMLNSGDLLELNQENYPNCFLHRSDPSDVARVEHLTFVCTENKDDVGPNNHWMEPKEAHAKMQELYDGCMKGRTMYVVSLLHGPD